jgi:hypothetical protein
LFLDVSGKFYCSLAREVRDAKSLLAPLHGRIMVKLHNAIAVMLFIIAGLGFLWYRDFTVTQSPDVAYLGTR